MERIKFLILIIIILLVSIIFAETQFIVHPQDSPYWTGTTDGISKTEPSIVRGHNLEDGWMMFDVSSIPPGTEIDRIEFHGFVNDTQQPDWSITPMNNDPVNTNAADIYFDINDEANDPALCYLFLNEGPGYSSGVITHILGGNANSDLENVLTSGWFSIGIACRNDDPSHWIIFDGWEQPDSPYLVVKSYTHVSGPVGGVWNTVDGPYVVDGDIFVQAGESLFIEGGVHILFSGNYHFYVHGILNASGNSGNPIFIGPHENNYSWKGISMEEDVPFPRETHLNFVNIHNAAGGVKLDGMLASMHNVSILYDTIAVRDTASVGVSIIDETSTLIDDCTIEGYPIGVQIENSEQILSTPTITNCRIRNSTEQTRTEEIGVNISGLVALEMEETFIEDYPYGVNYIGTGSSTADTPTLTNCRIRNSTENTRPREVELLTGIYLEDIINIEVVADSIIGYETGVDIFNSVSRTESTPTLTNCRIRNSTENTRTETTGINIEGFVSAEIDNCDLNDYHKSGEITNNSGSTSTPTLTNCRIRNSTENTRDSFIGLEFSGDITGLLSENEFVNCDSALIFDQITDHIEIGYNLFYLEDFVTNSIAFSGNDLDTLTFYNNTIYSYDYAFDADSTNSYLYNNIIWETTYPIQATNSNLTVEYNDIEGGYTGTGNIDEDPSFADETNYMFFLYWDSPCIDSGTGDDDPDGTVADMGAFYFHQIGTPSIPENILISIDPDSVEISWDEAENSISYSIYSSDDPYESSENWDLEESGIRTLNWIGEICDPDKYYYVIGVNGIPISFKMK